MTSGWRSILHAALDSCRHGEGECAYCGSIFSEDDAADCLPDECPHCGFPASGSDSFHPLTGIRLELTGRLMRTDVDRALQTPTIGVKGLDPHNSPTCDKIRAMFPGKPLVLEGDWVVVDQSWRCPSCARSKPEIARLSPKGFILCKLVVHHDHMGDALRSHFAAAIEAASGVDGNTAMSRQIDFVSGAFAAFEPTRVCEDCNNADVSAKRAVGAPREFSFSPHQISEFISPSPNSPHTIDNVLAAAVWSRVSETHAVRMDLMQSLASAVATQTHWFEPQFADTSKEYRDPLPEDSTKKLIGGHSHGARLAGVRVDKWRRQAQPESAFQLADHHIRFLRSKPGFTDLWERLGPEWRCLVCDRDRNSCVTMGRKKQPVFRPREHLGSRASTGWARGSFHCDDCDRVLAQIAAEIRSLGLDGVAARGILRPHFVQLILDSGPNRSHRIRSERAAALIDWLESELRHK